MNPNISTTRKDPFDDPGWTFELKYDGFRGVADTSTAACFPRTETI
jgi:hypothetical protein